MRQQINLHSCKELMSRSWKPLGKYICNLKSCRNMRKINSLTYIFITYVITSHFNILWAFVEDRIFSNPYGTSIINI